MLVILDPTYGERLKDVWPGQAVWITTANERARRQPRRIDLLHCSLALGDDGHGVEQPSVQFWDSVRRHTERTNILRLEEIS